MRLTLCMCSRWAIPLRPLGFRSSLIRSLSSRQLETAAGFAHGRMKKKILGAQEALQGGVVRVIIADGRALNPITQALSGEGTIIAERLSLSDYR